jgi:hypothetical protein
MKFTAWQSKQMCQPAAPHEMKPRSMFCHRIRRVPAINGFEFPPDVQKKHRTNYGRYRSQSRFG